MLCCQVSVTNIKSSFSLVNKSFRTCALFAIERAFTKLAFAANEVDGHGAARSSGRRLRVGPLSVRVMLPCLCVGRVERITVIGEGAGAMLAGIKPGLRAGESARPS